MNDKQNGAQSEKLEWTVFRILKSTQKNLRMLAETYPDIKTSHFASAAIDNAILAEIQKRKQIATEMNKFMEGLKNDTTGQAEPESKEI